MNTMVYGNLALAPRADEPQLRVYNGNACSRLAAAPLQLAPADVYAKTSACPHTRFSHIRALAGFMALLGLAVTLFSLFGAARASAQDAFIASLDSTEVTVRAGDSLWSLAEDHAVEGLPISAAVDLISEWNGLDNATLQPGMELVVPAIS